MPPHRPRQVPDRDRTPTGTGSPYDDGTYRRHNPTWHVEDSRWKAAKVASLVRDRGLAPRRVVDIGCGAGAVLLRLSEELGPEAELVGYDISADALADARTRVRGKLRFVHGTFPPADEPPFDLALALDVLEHLEDPFDFLRRLHTVAAYQVLHIPLDLSVQGVWRGRPLAEVRRTLGHLHAFTKDTALALLAETGFEVLWHGYTCGSLDLPPRRPATRLMILPRRLLSGWRPDFAARLLGGFSLLVLTR